MKTNLIKFYTQDEMRLDGLLFEPDNKTDKVIINVHGASGSFYTNKYIETFANELTKNGYAFLTFNNRGSEIVKRFYKERDGVIIERVHIGSENEVFEDCSIDIQAAVDFAKSKGFNDIVLCGHCYGCQKVIWFAIDKEYKGKIILLSPCDIKDHISKHKARDITNYDFFRYETKTIMPAVQKLDNDILVQIGTLDHYIGYSNLQICTDYLVRAFSKSKLHCDIIQNANHNFEGKYFGIAQNILAWLNS